ncbi:hypothetical protein [Thermovirga sp.]|uniref:hypothetical protein n=1 Tax=Thermovirga sp. TaxID=2699834 RepID=UPI0025FC86E7|nr:hypothetical protein [Thermovirga sp.]MBO8154505.1 hypothetical protein [Thermovirga sp.]
MLKDSPLPRLLECGCSSPAAVNNAEAFLPDDGRVVFCSDFCEALEGSEWPYSGYGMASVQVSGLGAPIFNGRNQYFPKKVRNMGFVYYGIGKP